MTLSVQERGATLATFRFVQVELMETLARWVPTTPEMEVKLLFGTHIWEVAQHADALGKRVFELRMPLQHSLKPADVYCAVLGELSAASETVHKLAGFYEAFLPVLGDRYRRYLGRTDSLMDAPSVRIIERILEDHSRMFREHAALLAQLPALRAPDPEWATRLRKKESSIEDFVAPPAAVKAAEAS
jgi:hypothetical protein